MGPEEPENEKSRKKKVPWNPKRSMEKTARTKLKIERRMMRVEEMMLRGINNRAEIAAAFGVDISTVQIWEGKVRKRWLERSNGEIEEIRAKRVQQMEFVGRLAMSAFERSKQDEVEYSTTTRNCSECRGAGQLEERPDEWESCPECNGTGKIEVSTTKVKGKPGDSSFLRVAKEAFLEAAKLEGIAPSNTKMSAILKESKLVGSEIHERVRELYIEADSDKILRARAALEELREEISKGQATIEQGEDVIEGRVVEDKEDQGS